MGAVKMLARFSGADTAGPPNVGNVWSAVDDIDNPQSTGRQSGYELNEVDVSIWSDVPPLCTGCQLYCLSG